MAINATFYWQPRSVMWTNTISFCGGPLGAGFSGRTF